jgi:excisionase family DNA binding protein
MDTNISPNTTITRLLRPDEVAMTLNISKALAYQLIRNGQIPAIRFNRTIRIRPLDLEAYIERSFICLMTAH